MDDSRFVAWTRRRFGIAAASAVAGLLGLRGREDALARRKKRKKRKKRAREKPQCEQHRTRCNPKNDHRLCCGGLFCQEVPELGGHHCCRPRFGECEQDSDCCGNTACVAGFCDVA
jgi:hypothetical protein